MKAIFDCGSEFKTQIEHPFFVFTVTVVYIKKNVQSDD
jgi:hypothetical protein